MNLLRKNETSFFKGHHTRIIVGQLVCGCISDRGPAASGGQTVLANDRNGGRLRLIASRHDDDELV